MNRSDIPSHHRAHRNGFLQWLGCSVLKFSGWKIKGQIPCDRKIIIAMAPHTSNWDFVFGLSALLAIDLNVHWVGKHTMFKAPFRKLLVSLGGVPLDRGNPKGVVEQIAGRMLNADRMIIGIMPEGTRSKVERWKTGFLRIAKAAHCKVLPVGLDYGQKCLVLGDLLKPYADVEQQTVEIKEHFRQYHPKRPELF